MNVSLTPELEKFIKDQVDGGMYSSASEVVRASLRFMYMYYERVQKQSVLSLNQAIDVGIEQLHRGKRISGEESYKNMKRKLDKIKKGE